jgi:hypothetical protein
MKDLIHQIRKAVKDALAAVELDCSDRNCERSVAANDLEWALELLDLLERRHHE